MTCVRKGKGWLPSADWLLGAATTLCLLFVILPLVSIDGLRFPAAAAGSDAILVAGYIPANYGALSNVFVRERLFWGARREGPRDNPEPSKRILVWTVTGLALLFFLWRILPPSN